MLPRFCDPFEVDGWFVLELVAFQVLPADD